jgi:diacylglycerol kinase (ATP)
MVNANSRRGKYALDQVSAALKARGHDVMLAYTQSAKDVSPAIAEHAGRMDVVVVGGGDGSLIAAFDGIRKATADHRAPIRIRASLLANYAQG